MTASPRPPFTILLFFPASWILGLWLLFDGLHFRLFGDYARFGGQLGPWADLATAIGLRPGDFCWTFILLGSALMAVSFGLLGRGNWAWQLGLAASVVLLFYIGFGTPFAIACVGLLLTPPTRRYLQKI